MIRRRGEKKKIKNNMIIKVKNDNIKVKFSRVRVRVISLLLFLVVDKTMKT